MEEEKKGIHPSLERYLELCQRMYERMERENSWPWKEEGLESKKPEEAKDDTPHVDTVFE